MIKASIMYKALFSLSNQYWHVHAVQTLIVGQVDKKRLIYTNIILITDRHCSYKVSILCCTALIDYCSQSSEASNFEKNSVTLSLNLMSAGILYFVIVNTYTGTPVKYELLLWHSSELSSSVIT